MFRDILSRLPDRERSGIILLYRVHSFFRLLLLLCPTRLLDIPSSFLFHILCYPTDINYIRKYISYSLCHPTDTSSVTKSLRRSWAFNHLTGIIRKQTDEHGRHKHLFFFYSVFHHSPPPRKKAARVILHLAHTVVNDNQVNAKLFCLGFSSPSSSCISKKKDIGEAHCAS